MRSLRIVFLPYLWVLAIPIAMSASGQKTDVKFALPVTYDSGAPGAGSVAVADLRGNGKLDLVVADYCQAPGQDSCQGYGQAAVLLGNGDGTFEPAQLLIAQLVANVNDCWQPLPSA
jgi:hypothetical protein